MLTLVTGATGLVGNNVVRQLLAAGQPVRVLRRATSDQRPLAGLDIEILTGDVGDVMAVERAVQGADRVIHAAAEVRIGWQGLESARAINVAGTRNVAIAALRAGARLVHVSSVDALGLRRGAEADEDTAPSGGVLCPYVITKREAEQAILDSVQMGLEAVIVNPAFMLGPWAHCISACTAANAKCAESVKSACEGGWARLAGYSEQRTNCVALKIAHCAAHVARCAQDLYHRRVGFAKSSCMAAVSC